MLIEAQAKSEIKKAEAQQKLENNQQKFIQGQQNKAVQTMANVATSDAKTSAEIIRGNARAQAEAENQTMNPPKPAAAE